MPLTVVFDDLKGYPEPETIITKVREQFEKRNMRGRHHGIPLALMRDAEATARLNAMASDPNNNEKLDAVSDAYDDLSHALHGLLALLDDTTPIFYYLDRNGCSPQNLRNNVLSDISGLGSRMPLLDALTVTVQCRLTSYQNMAYKSGKPLYRASANTPPHRGIDVSQFLQKMARNQATTLQRCIACGHQRRGYEGVADENGNEGYDDEHYVSPNAHGGAKLLTSIQWFLEAVKAPVGRDLDPGFHVAEAFDWHATGHPSMLPYLWSVFAEPGEIVDRHIVACEDAYLASLPSGQEPINPELDAANAQMQQQQRESLAALERMQCSADTSDMVHTATSAAVAAVQQYSPTRSSALANARILRDYLQRSLNMDMASAPLTLPINSMVQLSHEANSLLRRMDEFVMKLDTTQPLERITLASYVYGLTNANLEAHRMLAMRANLQRPVWTAMYNVWQVTEAFGASHELYMNPATPLVTRAYDTLPPSFQTALQSTDPTGAPNFFRLVCETYFKKPPPSAASSAHTTGDGDAADRDLATSALTVALGFTTLATKTHISDDLRNTNSNGCRLANDYGAKPCPPPPTLPSAPS